MNLTSISWTDYSSNPLKYRDPDGNIVHACVHKSGGCSKCYAEALAGRWGRKGLPFTAENMKRLTPFMDEKEIRAILTCKAASGKRCFPFDMTDLAGEWISDALIDQAFAFMALRPDIEFQILTKRIERLLEYVRKPGVASDVADVAKAQFAANFKPSHPLPTEIKVYPMGPMVDGQPEFGCRWFIQWPLPNVLIGTSIEDQANLDLRYPAIAQIKQLKWRTFLSLEPLLGPVDMGFGRWIRVTQMVRSDLPFRDVEPVQPGIYRADSNKHGALSVNGLGIKPGEFERMPDADWAIIGGESGHHAREFDIEWAISAIHQCRQYGIVPFLKQLGSNPVTVHRGMLGETLFPQNIKFAPTGAGKSHVLLKSSHGTDMAEWPESLRHQEWPSK